MVHPFAPITSPPTGGAASPEWHVPLPIVAPPRDPPKWWSVAAEPASEHRRIRYELIAMLVLIALPGFLVGLDGITDPSTIDIDGLSVLDLLASIAGSAGAAMMAAYLLWRDGALPAAGLNRRRPGFVLGYGLLGLVCCYGAILAVGLVAIAVSGVGEEATSTDRDTGVSLTAASLAAAYLISLSAGITEEIVFRAYAITRLEQLGWKKAAFIVPGVVFTLLHLYQGVIAIFAIGSITVVLTWLYKWKRSLLPVMLAHALFDAGQLTLAALLSR